VFSPFVPGAQATFSFVAAPSTAISKSAALDAGCSTPPVPPSCAGCSVEPAASKGAALGSNLVGFRADLRGGFAHSSFLTVQLAAM